MNDYASEHLAKLRDQFPGWEIWWIRNAVTRQLMWFARPADAPRTTLSADTPEELADAIRGQS